MTILSGDKNLRLKTGFKPKIRLRLRRLMNTVPGS